LKKGRSIIILQDWLFCYLNSRPAKKLTPDIFPYAAQVQNNFNLHEIIKITNTSNLNIGG